MTTENRARMYKFIVLEEERAEALAGYEPTIHLGIKYEDKVICGCCGYVFSIDEVRLSDPVGWIDIEEAVNFEEWREEDII